MQFRFREYNKETSTYKLIGVQDYDEESWDVALKSLTVIMKENKKGNIHIYVELNEEGFADSEGVPYFVKDVSMTFNKVCMSEDDKLMPYVSVDVVSVY